MNRRDPLTYRYPRTLAELDSADSADRARWIRAEASAADDEHTRALVAEGVAAQRRTIASTLVRVALLVAVAVLFVVSLWQGL